MDGACCIAKTWKSFWSFLKVPKIHDSILFSCCNKILKSAYSYATISLLDKSNLFHWNFSDFLILVTFFAAPISKGHGPVLRENESGSFTLLQEIYRCIKRLDGLSIKGFVSTRNITLTRLIFAIYEFLLFWRFFANFCHFCKIKSCENVRDRSYMKLNRHKIFEMAFSAKTMSTLSIFSKKDHFEDYSQN